MYHLQEVFHKLCSAELTMKVCKCHFFAEEIQYLGYVLSSTTIKPLTSKTAAIKLMNPPKNAKQVRVFLTLVGYYCTFIKNFVCIAKLLTTLTCHDAKFVWASSHLTAFNILKSALLEAPILHYPSKHYIVYTDTSDNPLELRCLKNMMVRNFQLHSSCTHLQTANGNGTPQN